MKIGILDHELTNYHIKKFHGILTGEIGRGSVEIVGASEGTPSPEGEAWCTENNVRYLSSFDEVIGSSDALMVLAPNNPERHLELATPALKSGKPVFIDKMLAHTPDDAQEILRVAHEHQTPVFSSSSLRFAQEITELAARVQSTPEAVFVRGLGKFPIYAVHSLAMAMPFIGSGISGVIDTGTPVARTLTLDAGALRATVEVRESENQYEATPWQVGVLTSGRYEVATVTNFDGFYENLVRAMIEFFRTGKSPVSVEEQLAIVQVQDAAEKSLAQGGEWVTIKQEAYAFTNRS